MAADETESFSLEQNFAVRELLKSREIYWRICDVYEETYFSEKKNG